VAPNTVCASPRSMPPYLLYSVSWLYLLHLVLRRSTPNADAVDLPLVYCRTRALPDFTRYVYFLYSAPAHSQPVFKCFRCCAPAHLSQCLLFVHAGNSSNFKKKVPALSNKPTNKLSCETMYVSVCSLWSGLCAFSELVCDLLPRRLYDGFAKGALPEEYLTDQIFDKHFLKDTRDTHRKITQVIRHVGFV